MCCEPDHIGPPPEWYRDNDDTQTDYPRLPPGVRWGQGSAALSLALWDALGLTAWRRPGPRPVSTEGGRGRAEPGARLGDDVPSKTWRELHATPDGGGGLGDQLAGFLPPNRLTGGQPRT